MDKPTTGIGRRNTATQFRNFSKITNETIKPITSLLPSLLSTTNTAENLAELYNTTVTNMVNILAPLKKCHAPTAQKKLISLAPETHALRSSKRRAHRLWQKSKSIEDKEAYASAAKLYKEAIMASKKQYFEARISDAKIDTKEIFKILRELENPDTKPPDPIIRDNAWCQQIQDAMFGKVDRLKSEIENRKSLLPPSNTISPAVIQDRKPFYFTEVSEADMANIIATLKPTSCRGDICPASVVKVCSPTLLSLITKFVNSSLMTGNVPASIKQSWISPLLKKSTLDPTVPTNYRPITNVPFLLKILDKVAYTQILQYIQDNKLLSTRQSGFRVGHSTESALLDLKSSLHQLTDKGEIGLLMLLDLSAAFDLVDHSILVERLQSTMSFSLEAASWVDSFLSNRRARVFHQESAADPVYLTCGVPQGACLSPMLYNLFTRPLFDLLDDKKILYTNYADDTQVVLHLTGNHNIDTLTINSVFSTIQEWMATNGLALNDSKTELLLTGTAHKIKSLPPAYKNFVIAGCIIPVSDRVKTLGVFFDSTLSMKAHVNYLSSSTSYYIRLFYQIRPFLSTDTCASIARAIVGAKIDYCGSLLSGTCQYNINKLQVLQNSAVRVVAGLRRHDHVSEARRKLHWLPVRARIQFRTLTITHKVLFGSAPSYLKDRLKLRNEVRTLRSNCSNLLQVPRCRLKTAGGLAFDFLAPQLWNALPPELRNEQDLPKFKKLLKTTLFD